MIKCDHKVTFTLIILTFNAHSVTTASPTTDDNIPVKVKKILVVSFIVYFKDEQEEEEVEEISQ